IQISSINGLKGQYGQANYAAAKAGMHGFTISLARENAKLGITVNTVSPGYVATDMVMAVPEEVRAKIAADIPTGRLGKPEEIAYAVAFLVDEQASWITGSNLDIHGGHHMGWCAGRRHAHPTQGRPPPAFRPSGPRAAREIAGGPRLASPAALRHAARHHPSGQHPHVRDPDHQEVSQPPPVRHRDFELHHDRGRPPADRGR